MAYKFQLGNAKLGGTLQQDGGLVSTDVDDTTAANIVAEIDNGEIPIAKLAARRAPALYSSSRSTRRVAKAEWSRRRRRRARRATSRTRYAKGSQA